MKTWILTFILILGLAPIIAQDNVDYIPGDIIVQLHPTHSIDLFLEEINANNRQVQKIALQKTVSETFNIHLLQFDPNQQDQFQILQDIEENRRIKYAQFNHILEYRNTTPNDDLFNLQWHMNIIDADEAWDVTTGGLTANGDTIVVAVFDGGCDIDHEDLKDNIWRNHGEIPEDDLDNDDNGYTDDYLGLNVATQNDNHVTSPHGTAVAGIVGSKGNNGIGTTGVNWDVKLLIMSSITSQANVIEGYEYCYKLRNDYNISNGQSGAFIVATNYSLGIPNTFCTAWQMWDDMITELGKIGIITVGATDNANVNVDETGDIPSTCQSDFLISVTNTTNQDEKFFSAAIGPINVDLGAPGHNSYSTEINDDYDSFSGTSGATPHVSGAIALLYSIPCEELADQAISNPELTAQQMKAAILNGVDELEDLKSTTVSGGRLNLFQSIEMIQEIYGNKKGKLSFLDVYPNPSSNKVYFSYQTPDFTTYDIKLYNAMGQLLNNHVIPEICAPQTLELNVRDLPSGVYIISIENDNDIVSTKFVVQSNYD